MSFTVHKILASITDDEERFAVILTPPEGRARWAPDEANRRIGRRVVKPVAPQEKVSAIHSLAQDEKVAATVTGDLFRRPAVVARVSDEGKIRVVAEPTREDQVAAAVVPDFLRRPAVVAWIEPASPNCSGSQDLPHSETGEAQPIRQTSESDMAGQVRGTEGAARGPVGARLGRASRFRGGVRAPESAGSRRSEAGPGRWGRQI
ncbi:DUF6192 family protein [Streptomyces sp. NPDC002164]|uniref:DUF6192 family protein n=1 Tax=unclassified Streptomyces TaxID=2593676 RepID=UPI0036745C3C